jgi:hypothetical protein
MKINAHADNALSGKRQPGISCMGLFCLISTLAALAPVHASGWKQHHQSLDTEFNALKMIREGRDTFRFDNYGNEDFWGGQLRLHEAIAGEANGGSGPGVSPATALAVGLKVDKAALPRNLQRAILRGDVDLQDPAVTIELLRLNAVIGVKGVFDENNGNLSSMGITCALCHSTVDDSLTTGIGHRRDGWANRDLNVGAIIALSPSVTPFSSLLGVDDATVRTVLNSWGPGKFDASLLMDGKAFRPDGKPAAVLIPPAFGLAGVNQHTWTGWGSVTHWNAFVAVLEMQGKGTFYDPRLNDASKFPVAAANGFADVRRTPDLVSGKLAALQFYQLALNTPEPPRGSYDRHTARKGEQLFNGKAGCARCHVPPLYTEPGWNMHTAEEIGIDDFQSSRAPEEAYRTAPLKGLWTHTKGGFYHDGRFATLDEVIEHYDDFFSLDLSDREQYQLAEFLKSL